jgi:hypothetical protein
VPVGPGTFAGVAIFPNGVVYQLKKQTKKKTARDRSRAASFHGT